MTSAVEVVSLKERIGGMKRKSKLVNRVTSPLLHALGCSCTTFNGYLSWWVGTERRHGLILASHECQDCDVCRAKTSSFSAPFPSLITWLVFVARQAFHPPFTVDKVSPCSCFLRHLHLIDISATLVYDTLAQLWLFAVYNRCTIPKQMSVTTRPCSRVCFFSIEDNQ